MFSPRMRLGNDKLLPDTALVTHSTSQLEGTGLIERAWNDGCVLIQVGGIGIGDIRVSGWRRGDDSER